MCRARSPTIASRPHFSNRLLEAEREAEVDRAGEILLGAVEPVNAKQFLGPQHSQRLAGFGPDFVLPAVAARRGDERRPHPLPVSQHREQPVILVVWMRVGLHEGPGAGELAQQELERDAVGPLSDRRDAQLRLAGSDEKGQEEREGEGAAQACQAFGCRPWALGGSRLQVLPEA